jgi:hypothetical protein
VHYAWTEPGDLRRQRRARVQDGPFDSIHAIACPDDKTVYVANEFSYRFDKVVLE